MVGSAGTVMQEVHAVELHTLMTNQMQDSLRKDREECGSR
jgi:hypothetical protein